MLRWASFGVLVFWNACNRARLQARLSFWLNSYFYLDDHLRVRTISVFSVLYCTYRKLLRFSLSLMLKYRLVWSDSGLVPFCRRSDALIVDNVELSVNLYCIMF